MKRSLRALSPALLLAASLAAGLLLPSITPARSAAVRVGKSSAVAFNFDPVDIGIREKFFQNVGLDVEVVNLAGSAKLQQAMIAGSVEFGLGAGTDVAFLVKGAPEVAVGAIALTPALFGVTVPYDSPARTLADLKGKRIGISTVGSLTQWLALQLEKKQGWPPNSLTMVTDGSSPPPQLAALKTGQIDAQISSVGFGWNLEQHKEGRLLAPASEFVGPFLMNVIFTTDTVVQQDPDTIRRFLNAWYQAVDFMARHKAETVAIARSIDHYSPEVEDKQYDVVMPSMSLDGRFPPEAVATVRHSFVELRILDSEPDMSKYLTERFLQPAR
ncbi:MAG TPA: ABC transporter substrate-binding protein [Stellaceae bacterium]|nr:ABC transporter substrate-binding protein [Stellaceae bacterium]